MRGGTRRTLHRATAGLVVLTLAAPVGATSPGENGRIAFVSGMGGAAGNDNSADVYLLSGPNGTVTKLTGVAGQHRHPDWSPDLTELVYALNGTVDGGDGTFDLWFHRVGTTSRSRETGPDALREDRPAFSPDGSLLAYEAEMSSGGQWDILVKDLATDVVFNLTNTPNHIEGKPIWSRDGQYVYFSRRPVAGGNDDILRERADGVGSPVTIINGVVGVEDQPVYQAALAPDDSRMCYTRGPFGSTDADVWVANMLGPQNPFNLSDSDVGAYNCAWSPDGKRVTYVNGVFSNGALVHEKADDTGSRQNLTTNTADHFDGNPAWAPRFPALCLGIPATIVGTEGPDVIVGTDERDVVATFTGDDTVNLLDGDDILCLGKGKDTGRGRDGDDRLLGGSGNDKLYGNADQDIIRGGKGIDLCDGGPGTDNVAECE